MNTLLLEKFDTVVDLLVKKENESARTCFNNEIKPFFLEEIKSNKTITPYRILFYELDELFNNSQRQAIYPSDLGLILSEYKELKKTKK
jgi:hypothetical protein